MLCEGNNVIGAALGDGWYVGHVAIAGKNQYGSEPRFLLQMCIEYEDQAKVIIPSNTTATVYIPAGQNDLITEQGSVLKQNSDIQLIGWEKGFYVVKISSGKYQFVVAKER